MSSIARTDWGRWAYIESVVRRLSYKPDWKFTAFEGRITIRFVARDTQNPDRKIVISDTLVLGADVPEDMLIRHIYHRVLALEQHEASEHFKVDGHDIFNEHVLYPERFKL